MAKKVTPADVVRIAELREKGWSYPRIASQFLISTGLVHYYCLKQGAVSPRSHSTGLRKGPQTYVAGDGRTQRRFSADEDARMVDLRKAGRTITEIHRITGRPMTSVRIRLMTLALHDEGQAA